MDISYGGVGYEYDKFLAFWRGEYRKRDFLLKNVNKIKDIRAAYRSVGRIFEDLCAEGDSSKTEKEDFIDSYCMRVLALRIDRPVEVEEKFITPIIRVGNIVHHHDDIKYGFDKLCDAVFSYNLLPSFLLRELNSYKILKDCSEGCEKWDAPPTLCIESSGTFVPDSSVKVNLNFDDDLGEIEKEILEEYRKKMSSEKGYFETLIRGSTASYHIELKAYMYDSSFDIDNALEKFHEQLVWAVYDVKRQRSMPLTERERSLVDASFQKLVVGSAGPTHAVGRAVGLWLWDYLQENPSSTRTPAYIALNKLGLNIPYRFEKDNPSIRKTLDRIFNSTKKCIETNQVLPIKGGTGK